MPTFQNDIESQVCNDINAAIQSRNANQLQSILLLEPPFPPAYQQLIVSLQRHYPESDATSETRLEELIKRILIETDESEDADGRPVQGWGAMVSFLAGWMAFIRDLDIENLLATYQRLSELQQQANSALQHPTKGILMLPLIISYSKVFSRVALGLDKRPELISDILAATTTDEGRRESLPEKAANIVRQAFITCLNDRNTAPRGVTKDEKPDGKKIGIYKMANICLKILFQAQKLDSCQTIFNNINNSSPPLRIYPASERVTYLYYLGRYHFANTDFFAAQLVLQQAYDDCPTDASCLKNRRLILVYLLGANLIMGRFPSSEVYTRPEARGFREIFYPITQAIRKGDLENFRRITDLNLTHSSCTFLSHYCMFYQIRNYCEVLLWRSLFRKVFLLTGQQGLTEKSAPTIDLYAVLLAFQYLERRAKYENPAMAAADQGPGRRQFGFLFQDFTKKDTYIDPDFVGIEGIEPYNYVPDILEMECVCGSLITQGFLNGYISHKSKRFAIQGARRAGSALAAGFPLPWQVIKSKNGEEILGWKKNYGTGTGGVVRLSGARPAGS